jgi:uncharacterized protein
VRTVLDVNVLVAALLSPSGSPARLAALRVGGAFDLVLPKSLLTEFERTLAYPRLRRHIDTESAAAFLSLLQQTAVVAPDPTPSVHRSADPCDDYLPALAEHARAILVSGDRHVLDLADGLPIETPGVFLNRLDLQ